MTAVARIPAGLTDSTGRYRLAMEDVVVANWEAAAPAERAALMERYGRAVQTPAGGYRPLPAARAFHRSQARFRVAVGGNRSSKSVALAQEVFWFATGTHPWRPIETPTTGWYATTTWDKVSDTLWDKLRRLLQGFPHQVVWHNRQREIPHAVLIPVAGGVSKVVFKAYEQGRESFQAAGLRYVANDEQFPQDVFVEQTSRIGGEYPLDFMAAFTPIESQPWMEEKLVYNRPAGWEVFEFPLDDNRVSRGGFIADELIDATIENWPPEVRETRRNGKWGSFIGSIFQTFDRDVHVVPEDRERALFFKRGCVPSEVIGSIDWGGSNPFVFLWACRIPHLDGDFYIFGEYFWDPKVRGGRRIQQHADEIKARCARWGVVLARTWADHDPTDALEMHYHGVPSQPAVKEVRAGIETVQTLLHPRRHLANADWPKGRPRLHIAARCANLVRELPTYRWQSGTELRDARDEPQKVNDHCCDCARYLLHGEMPLGSVVATDASAPPAVAAAESWLPDLSDYQSVIPDF